MSAPQTAENVGVWLFMDQPPYFPAVNEVLELAKIEAETMGCREIESDHIALGILRKGDGLAFEILEDLKVSPSLLESFILAAYECKTNGSGESAPESLDLTELLGQARLAARSLKQAWVGTNHLLIALSQDTGSAFGQYLKQQEITVENVQESTLRILDGIRVNAKSKSVWQPPKKMPTTRDGIIKALLDNLQRQNPDLPWLELETIMPNASDRLAHMEREKLITAWEKVAAMSRIGDEIPLIQIYVPVIAPNVLSSIPSEMVREYRALPIDSTDDELTVAVDSRLSHDVIVRLGKISHRRIVLVLTTKEDIDKAIAKYFPC